MIEELKKEHTTILNTLKNIKELNINSKEYQKELLSARDNILTHIKKEYKELYPVLRKSAEFNSRLKEVFDAFDEDMEELSKYTIDFFEYIFAEAGIEKEFELEKFIETHNTRMLREEAVLFSGCEKK